MLTVATPQGMAFLGPHLSAEDVPYLDGVFWTDMERVAWWGHHDLNPMWRPYMPTCPLRVELASTGPIKTRCPKCLATSEHYNGQAMVYHTLCVMCGLSFVNLQLSRPSISRLAPYLNRMNYWYGYPTV